MKSKQDEDITETTVAERISFRIVQNSHFISNSSSRGGGWLVDSLLKTVAKGYIFTWRHFTTRDTS